MKISSIENEQFCVLSHAAVVIGSSLICSKDYSFGYLRTRFDSNKEYLQDEIARRMQRDEKGDFYFTSAPRVIGYFNSSVIPFNTTHPGNYFHFLIESLPSLLGLIQGGLVNRQSLLVTGRMHENMQAALGMVTDGLNMSVLQMNVMDAIHCENVLSTRPSFHGSEFLNGEISRFTYDVPNLRLLRTFFKRYWSQCRPGRKLYVDRQSTQRNVNNNAELKVIAETAGFEVIDPGLWSFRDQISIFSSASIICGPTGAWVANLAFVPDSVKVTIFAPDTVGLEATLWTGLGEALQIDILNVRCPITQYNHYQPIHSDFNVPESIFMRALER